MHGLAGVAHPVPVDREADEAFAIAHEIIEHDRMKRGGARAGIDLGGDAGKAKLGQADKLAPADDLKGLHLLQGRIAMPSPPSPPRRRRSTVPLA